MKKLFFSILISIIIQITHGQSILQTEILSSYSSDDWKLIFYDEFNGNTLDASKWVTYYPYAGNGECEFCRTHGNEGQIYKDENVIVNNGTLKLIAKRESACWFGQTRAYTSGMIHSINSFKFLYGKFEMRGKIPYGMGFWPAFWLYGDEGNEIDIFEFGCQRPNILYTNVHKNGSDSSNGFMGSDFSNTFHIYTVEWNPSKIIFKVDGSEIRNMSWNPLIPDNPLNIILNLAIGNNDTPFTRSPNSSTILPNQFEIDWIKAYQKNPQNGFYDLCGEREILGSNIICGGNQATYTFNGNFLNLRWAVSSNLEIDYISNNSITVHPKSSTLSSLEWIQASDDIPCSQNTFIKPISIGIPLRPYINNGSTTSTYSTVDYTLLMGQTTSSLQLFFIDQSSSATSSQWIVEKTAYPSNFTLVQNDNSVFVTPNSIGTGSFTVKGVNQCGESSTTRVNLSIRQSGGHGPIDPPELPLDFAISPNPANDQVSITLQGNELRSASKGNSSSSKFEVQLWNATELIKLVKTGENSIQLPLGGLSSGTYYIRVIHNGKVKSKVFFKR